MSFPLRISTNVDSKLGITFVLFFFVTAGRWTGVEKIKEEILNQVMLL